MVGEQILRRAVERTAEASKNAVKYWDDSVAHPVERRDLRRKVFRLNQTAFPSESPNNAVLVGSSPAVIADTYETTLFYRAYERTDNFFNQSVASLHLEIFNVNGYRRKVEKCHVEEMRCKGLLLP